MTLCPFANQMASQVRKGDTPKEGNTRKQEEMLWEDRDRWKDVLHEVEMYGGGAYERQAE